jgi:hypothetical protein
MTQETPKARQDRLLVEELHEETLVYDLDRNEASCLNQAAAFVWKHCDGKRTVAELARLLSEKMGATLGEDVVLHALAQLREHHLLAEPAGEKAVDDLSRREFLKLGVAASVLPLVTSVIAPSADQFGSQGGPTGPTDADGPTGADNPDGDSQSDGDQFPPP